MKRKKGFISSEWIADGVVRGGSLCDARAAGGNVSVGALPSIHALVLPLHGERGRAAARGGSSPPLGGYTEV